MESGAGAWVSSRRVEPVYAYTYVYAYSYVYVYDAYSLDE
jgi:hypothetical protein